METITTVGIDLAKNVFQVHAVDAQGQVVFRKTVRRAALLSITVVIFVLYVPSEPGLGERVSSKTMR